MRNSETASFWLASSGPYVPNPPLAGKLRVDVAIIGGGFTGLSTAYHLCTAAPELRVAVLEAKCIGFGASGRNAGFSMNLFGLEPGLTRALFGQERTSEAYRYTERAVDYVQALIREHNMESDFEQPGMFRVATAPAYVRRIEHDLQILESLGVHSQQWVDATTLRAEIDSARFLGGWWAPRCGLLNPAKQVRELKRIAEARGAEVYEQTPVREICRATQFVLYTPGGTVSADKLVFATNAYSHLFPELRRHQVPIFTHMIISEPLTESQLAKIGWQRRQGLEDARNFLHYLRLTRDNRLAIGGNDISLAYGSDMHRDLNSRTFAALEHTVSWLFPALRGVRFSHRWGGPISVPLDLVPAIGQIGDRRALFSLGCLGHGVALSHLNGCTLADLLLERNTDLTSTWFVNRRVLRWPPEPLRMVAGQVIRAALRLQDSINEDAL